MYKTPYQKWEAEELAICEMTSQELAEFKREIKTKEKYNFNLPS